MPLRWPRCELYHLNVSLDIYTVVRFMLCCFHLIYAFSLLVVFVFMNSIYGVHDEAKDKAFELELSWICDESNRQHQKVTQSQVILPFS